MNNKKVKVNVVKFKVVKHEAHFSVRQLIIFALIFGCLGVYFIVRSFAASQQIGIVEAENMTLPASSIASVISDSLANGGNAVLFKTNGTISGQITASSAATQIVVRAKGTQCAGAPMMVVKIDNVQVQNVPVTSATWADYSAVTAAPIGVHSVNVSFTNSYSSYSGNSKNSKCVRDLAIDSIKLYGNLSDTTAPTAAVLSASAGDQQVTLNWTPSADNVGLARYEVWKNNVYVTTLTPDIHSYVATGLINGTAYSFRVVAYDSAANYANSNTVTVTPVAPVVTTPPPTTTSPSGQALPTGDLPGWKQIYTDDFANDVPLGSFPSAVSTKWSAYPYPWRDTKGQNASDPTIGGWYYPQKVVSMKGGLMDLWLHTETIDGAQKRLVSAPQPLINGTTAGQLYGRYAIRFRSDSLAGYKTAWLLWPNSGVWPRDGEIDFPEGDLDSTINGYMHWQGGLSGSDQYYAKSGKAYTDWHTAVIEWGPNRLAYYLDGALMTDASGGKSEWTTKVPNTPMHYVIQTETALGSVIPAATTQGHVQIDWVAVYSPL